MRVMTCVLALGLTLVAAAAPAAELGVLAPVVADGRAEQRPDPSGRPVPVVTRLREGELFDALQREAREGFTAHMLALDETAQQVAGEHPPQPTWLYLSQEEGGFARRGFWLQDGAAATYVDQPFVDLVVDAGSISDGGFEEIFAHEMGHVFLRRLLPQLPAGYSRTPHSVFSLTDPPTAFDEGFAIHFQALARRLTRNAALRAEDQGFDTRPLLPYWQSNRDRVARIDGVRRNLFVQAQRLPEGEGPDWRRAELSPVFDSVRLKTGQQMLSSEGVVATLFHRWIGDAEARALPARYRAWFVVMAALDGTELAPDAPVLLDLLRGLHARFPDTGAEAIAVFVDTTYGATIDPSVAKQTEALASAGQAGDIETFVGGLKSAREALAALRKRALSDPEALGAAVGPAVWVLVESDPARSVNLNLAGPEALRRLGLDEPGIGRLLASRESAGDFRDLDDAVRRAGLDAAIARRLTKAQAALQAAGRPQRP